ncbi:putative serine/threonine-protein kinase PBL5, partial [Bienertia sinuspersici]
MRNMFGCFTLFPRRNRRLRSRTSNPNLNRNPNPNANPNPSPNPVPQAEIPTSSSSYVGIVANEDPSASTSTSGRRFEYLELVAATGNFLAESRIGMGGSGIVYRGTILDTHEEVAIKRLEANARQDFNFIEKQFDAEVLTLRRANHPNIVGFIGFCAEGNRRLVVYEYMSLGSLSSHLAEESARAKMDWNTRMKIAVGVARGLEYVHHEMEPPTIYRDMKCGNILLDDEYRPKLSDFGNALRGDQDNTHELVVGTPGYCAPEYAAQVGSQLTNKADIYSFGVVLLQIISGCKAVYRGHHLTTSMKPLLLQRDKFHRIVDHVLKDQYHEKGLYLALQTAEQCLRENPDDRPTAAQVARDLELVSELTISPGSKRHRTQ